MTAPAPIEIEVAQLRDQLAVTQAALAEAVRELAEQRARTERLESYFESLRRRLGPPAHRDVRAGRPAVGGLPPPPPPAREPAATRRAQSRDQATRETPR